MLYSFAPTSDAYNNEVLSSVAHDEGRIVVTSSGSTLSYKGHWFVRDHLGSVRAVVDITSYSTSLQDIVIEQNDYLPFGTRSYNGYTPQFDSKDDQKSIKEGFEYAKQNSYRQHR